MTTTTEVGHGCTAMLLTTTVLVAALFTFTTFITTIPLVRAGQAPGASASPDIPQTDAKSTAIQYWTTLSQGNANKTTSFYLGNATLNWIGGPLNGKYTGSEQIHNVWSKFFKAWSSVKPTISNVLDTKGMNDITNVTAKVIFDNVNAISGKNATIPVNYQVDMKQIDGKFLIQNAIFKIMKKP